MEQIFKRIIPSRQADKLSNVQQNCLANSNCLHVASGSFAGLSSNVKRILGIKKALNQTVEGHSKIRNYKEYTTNAESFLQQVQIFRQSKR